MIPAEAMTWIPLIGGGVAVVLALVLIEIFMRASASRDLTERFERLEISLERMARDVADQARSAQQDIQGLRSTLERTHGEVVELRSRVETPREAIGGAKAADGAARETENAQSSLQREPSPGSPRPFTRREARAVYQEWKTEGTGIPKIPGWTIRWMRGAGMTMGNELEPGKPLLQESEGMGDFVRFSEQGSDTGLLFPNPHRDVEPDVHGEVFPGAGRRSSDTSIDAVVVARRSDGRWEPE